MRWSFMGPFETIALNAPGGIPDYCKRYGPSLARLSAADPSIYAGEKLAGLLALWERTPDANEVTACMAWRDRSRRTSTRRRRTRSQPAVGPSLSIVTTSKHQ